MFSDILSIREPARRRALSRQPKRAAHLDIVIEIKEVARRGLCAQNGIEACRWRAKIVYVDGTIVNVPPPLSRLRADRAVCGAAALAVFELCSAPIARRAALDKLASLSPSCQHLKNVAPGYLRGISSSGKCPSNKRRRRDGSSSGDTAPTGVTCYTCACGMRATATSVGGRRRIVVIAQHAARNSQLISGNNIDRIAARR